MSASGTECRSVTDRLIYWMREREAIRLKRLNGSPAPWTDDPILRTWRFCNVRRMDDAVSLWLLGNWYRPHFGHPSMLAAVALARFLNLPSSLGEITNLVFDPPRPNYRRIKTALRRIHRHRTVFNAAYMVRGNDGPDKIESVVDYNVRCLGRAKVAVDAGSMEATWQRIVNVRGFGSFMAGQVVADLRWALPGSWSDAGAWAPLGPGSLKGLNRLHGRPLSYRLDQAGFMVELAEVMAECRRRLPVTITDRLEAMDYQNCLCEVDKYCRVVEGGRCKQRYRHRE